MGLVQLEDIRYSSLQEELQANTTIKTKPFPYQHNILFLYTNFYTGEGCFHLSNEAKTLEWINYTPTSIYSPVKKRNGYGALTHILALLDVIKRDEVTKEFIINHQDPSPNRLAHLNGIGVHPGMNISDYIAQSITYANERGFHFDTNFKI